MEICPRCGSKNETKRAACWSCFAQLQMPGADKTTQEEPLAKSKARGRKAPEAEQAVTVVPEPVPATETTAPPTSPFALDPGESTESGIGQTTADEQPFAQPSDEPLFPQMSVEDAMAAPSVPEIPIFAETTEDSPAPQPFAPAMPDARAPAAETEVPPVFPEQEMPRRGRAAKVREPRPRPAGRRGSPVGVVVAIVVISALAGAWWFLLQNPSPEPMAKQFVAALNAAVSGDVQPLRTVASASSQAEVDKTAKVLSGIKRSGAPDMSYTLQKIDSMNVVGNQAEVAMTVGMAFNSINTKLNMPMRIALVREGSMLRKQWKVDLQTTERYGQEDAPRLQQEMMKQMPGMMQGAPR